MPFIHIKSIPLKNPVDSAEVLRGINRAKIQRVASTKFKFEIGRRDP